MEGEREQGEGQDKNESTCNLERVRMRREGGWKTKRARMRREGGWKTKRAEGEGERGVHH